jgi:hypothetical protein
MSEEGSGGMLTPIEAARRLDVPVRRIYELVQDGELLAYRGERCGPPSKSAPPPSSRWSPEGHHSPDCRTEPS